MNGSPKHLSNSCNNSKNDLGKSIYTNIPDAKFSKSIYTNIYTYERPSLDARSRQFEENLPRGAVPGRIWRVFVFVVMLQKELQTGAEKRSPEPTDTSSSLF